jgi:hypothetical protein
MSGLLRQAVWDIACFRAGPVVTAEKRVMLCETTLAKRPCVMGAFNSRRGNAEIDDVAQLSRPYQIALGAVAVLGLVWMMALRGHAANPSEPAPATPAPQAPAKTVAQTNPGAPTSVYHGAAPGVEGLTKAIAKAHGAVATSQRNAAQLQRKSHEASNEPRAARANAHIAAKATPAAAVQASRTAVLAREAAARRREAASAKAKVKSGLPRAQVVVEGELAKGKTVMLVFWDPKASVDREVQAEAKALAAGSKGTVTMHGGRANQVGTFGSITEVVHVYETPTILIVNRHGVVSTLTGLTDRFALKQAVREARAAS